MYSLHRLFYFAVAVTFASAFIVPGSVRAGPGDCAAYSAADIDGCFLAWAEASGFDALTDNVGVGEKAQDVVSAMERIMLSTSLRLQY